MAGTMFRFRRNKSELIVLTGAIYAFVAYLTAFTLEILFIVDLTRRSNEILSTASGSSSSTTPTRTGQITSTSASPSSSTTNHNLEPGESFSTPQLTSLEDDLFLRNTGLDRFKFESIQAHITISCLAISILYFIVFISSLVLIVALILRSTFMLLIWMCAMITMYLPEFCLVAYVSVYCWGPDTRNGQTEIIFYLARACFNAFFIFRAHKLFKQLNYEKNFFRLKSGGRTSVSSQFTGYDSPYFIGDSLTTTINPVFNSSTLNLNRYDYIRDHHFQPYGSSQGQSPTTNNSVFESELNDQSQASSSTVGDQFSANMQDSATGQAATRSRPAQRTSYSGHDPFKVISARTSKLAQINHRGSPGREFNYKRNIGHAMPAGNKQLGRFYLGDLATHSRTRTSDKEILHQPHQTSILSINDELDECELDLDYRTLGKSRKHNMTDERDRRNRHPPGYSRDQQLPGFDHDQNTHNNYLRRQQNLSSLSRSHDDLQAYSTQSLDRRNSREYALTEQVILRPLGHQPFEYLHRPGSTSNLDYLTTDPSASKPRNRRDLHY